MCRHVVIAFVVVLVGAVAIGSPASGQRFKVTTHRGVGVFGKNDRATRVQDKNIGEAGGEARSADDFRHFGGDFRRATAAGR